MVMSIIIITMIIGIILVLMLIIINIIMPIIHLIYANSIIPDVDNIILDFTI